MVISYLEMIMSSSTTLVARLIAFCASRSFGSFFKFGPFDTVAKTIVLVALAFLGASLGASLAVNTPILLSWELPLALFSGVLAALPGLCVHTIAKILNQDLKHQSVIF